MKFGRLRRSMGAAWLGLLALALNALAPVHLAFDLAEALGTARPHGAHAAAHSAEWHLLALVTGHRDGDGRPGGHDPDHRAVCPVFGAVGVLAGFVAPPPVVLATPLALALAPAFPASEGGPSAAPLTGYRSRAPPLA